MSLYVIVPSNSSTTVYPENTLTDFRMHMNTPLTLDGAYEVSLEEIQYRRNWYNVGENINNISVEIMDKWQNVKITPGYYATGKDLVRRIDGAIRKGVNKLKSLHTEIEKYIDALEAEDVQFTGSKRDICKVTFDPINRKCAFIMKPNVRIVLHGQLAAILGFVTTDIDLTFTLASKKMGPVVPSDHVFESTVFIAYKPETFKGITSINLDGGVTAMYIYSDIVEPQVVGDVLVPLLRVAPISGKYGAKVVKNWISHQYMPVRKNHFQDIRIVIRDGAGKPIPFQTGEVILTLHFRRRTDF